MHLVNLSRRSWCSVTVSHPTGNPLFVEELTKAVLEAGILVEQPGLRNNLFHHFCGQHAAACHLSAQETSRVFSHARNLLSDTGTLQEQMTILWGTYLAHSMRAEHSAALEVARQFLVLGADHDHAGVSALANRFMGQTLHFMGAFVGARVHLERALALCANNPEATATYRRFGVDDQVNTLSFLASTLLFLGYPEQSAATAENAETRARAMGRAYTTAMGFTSIAILGTVGGDPRRALSRVDEAIALSVENEFASLNRRARF